MGHFQVRSLLFGNATFLKDADFNFAKFWETANFGNAQFGDITAFKQAEFKKLVPEFHGANPRGRIFDKSKSNWPPPTTDRDKAEDQVHAYQRIKQEMEHLEKHEDEQAFFAKELRARRELYPRVSVARSLNLLYEILSDYGQSVIRPVVSLVVLFAISTVLFAADHLGPSSSPLALRWSVASIFSFLPSARAILTDADLKCISNAWQVAGIAQSILAAILLFLLVLALRNQFRMK